MKPRVEVIDNNIHVICDKCNTEHVFEFYTFGRYFLDNKPFVTVLDPDETDQFNVDGGLMWPQFVCRNFRCHREEVTLYIENDRGQQMV